MIRIKKRINGYQLTGIGVYHLFIHYASRPSFGTPRWDRWQGRHVCLAILHPVLVWRVL